jgi:hypothetical protein
MALDHPDGGAHDAGQLEHRHPGVERVAGERRAQVVDAGGARGPASLPVEPLPGADRRERLSAGHRPTAGERIESRQRQLSLAYRQPALRTEAGVPARGPTVKARRLYITREQKQCQPIRERDLRNLGRQRPSLHEVAPSERPRELAIGPALACHERMFA